MFGEELLSINERLSKLEKRFKATEARALVNAKKICKIGHVAAEEPTKAYVDSLKSSYENEIKEKDEQIRKLVRAIQVLDSNTRIDQAANGVTDEITESRIKLLQEELEKVTLERDFAVKAKVEHANINSVLREKELLATIEEKNEKIEKLLQELEELDADELNTYATHLEEKVRNLTDALTEVEVLNTQYKDEIEHLQAEIDQTNIEKSIIIEEQKKEIEVLKQALEKKEEMILRISQKQAELTRDYKSLLNGDK